MKRAIKTREKLLDAAVDLFAANRFGGTSIRDIARMTDMTIPNIYYHFGSKEGLLIAILERAMQQIVERSPERSLAEEISSLWNVLTILRTHFDLLVNVGRKEADILFLEEEHVLGSGSLPDRAHEHVRRELRGLQTLGYVNQKNLTVLAFNIFGVINWHLRWYKPDGKDASTRSRKRWSPLCCSGCQECPAPNSLHRAKQDSAILKGAAQPLAPSLRSILCRLMLPGSGSERLTRPCAFRSSNSRISAMCENSFNR